MPKLRHPVEPPLISWLTCFLGPLKVGTHVPGLKGPPDHTNAFSKVCCHWKLIDRFMSTLPFWHVFQYPCTLKHLKTIELHVIMQVKLFAHATNTCTCEFLVIVFILIHFWPSTLIRYVCIFFLIHCHQHFQIDAFLMITLSILSSVDRRPKCIDMRTGPKFQTPLFHFLRGKPCPCQHFTIAFVLVFIAVTVSTHLCHLSPFHLPCVAVSRPYCSPDFTPIGSTISDKISWDTLP